MNHLHKFALSFAMLWFFLVGCGSTPTSLLPPASDACSGVVITGSLLDTLTHQPVHQGWVALESGTQFSSTKIYNFNVTQQTTVNSDGSFKLCAASISSPSAVVAIALDASANAASVAGAISETVDLGTLPMGGCTLICGLEDEQQTSAPATITGLITTAPIAKSGTVLPQYAMTALDGSANLWSLAMPVYNTSQPFIFTTAATGCPAKTPYCASYTFTVPTQKPVTPAKNGYTQQAGAPTYSIYSAVTSCSPASALETFQLDGASPLEATPGATLSAGTTSFSACQ
jgi:hypothetical protein